MKWFVYHGYTNTFSYHETQEEARKELLEYIKDERDEAERYGEFLSDDLGEMFMGVITHEAKLVPVDPIEIPDDACGEYADIRVVNPDGSYTREPETINNISFTTREGVDLNG